ncbi:unnamed protein product [Discula destructiva]
MIEDLPLALRRTRRSITARVSHDQPTPPQTPTRSRGSNSNGSRHTRFSHSKTAKDNSHSSSSTGLTPFIRRATLTHGHLPSSSATRRRSCGQATTSQVDVFNPCRDTGYSGEVTFLPLRQVLDGRVKRRIRRNGLSEEMNVITADKRRRTQQTQAEMDALRVQLAAKDAEIRRLSGATQVADEDGQEFENESIDDLKREADRLRRNLNRPAPSLVRASSVDSEATEIDWSRSTEGEQQQQQRLLSEACLEMDYDFDDNETIDDHVFSDETMAELACSTPSRRPTDARPSFLTPPSTISPRFRLRSPVFRSITTPTSHASVQTTQLPDLEKQQLEDELASLHLEVDKLTSTLSTYESMTARLSAKLTPLLPHGGGSGSAAEAILGLRSPTIHLEAQLTRVLAARADLHASLATLGFPGPDTVAALSSAFRAARLELEYLAPGESTLPLSAGGAAVLDALLARLRELARQNRESDDVIDEYVESEASLQRQLGARVEAMDEMRDEVAVLKDKVRLRNGRIRELESGMDKLRATVKGYTRDISELEGLAQGLEGELDTAKKDLANQREEGQEHVEGWLGAIKKKDTTAALLEGKLGLVLKQVAELKEQVSGLQRQQAIDVEEVDALHQEHGSTLATKDARVEELSAEVDRVTEALQSAQETIEQLRREKGALDGQLDGEKVKAKLVFDTMRAEMERAVRMGASLLATTPPPTSPIGM